MSLIKYLIAGGLGFGVAKLLDDSKKTGSKDSKTNDYIIYGSADDMDKINMKFFNFEDAKKMYDKIVKSKKIKYKDIIANDETERGYYDSWLAEGNIGKEGYPKLSDVYTIQEIFFYINDDEIFSFENTNMRFNGGGKVKKVKFDIDEDEDEDRTEISIKGIGEVILTGTYPEYEFIDDVDEETLEELGVEEGDMIGKIEHIKINDEYKGQGYAKLLMTKAIEEAKEKGLMPLYLNASPMGNRGLDIDDLTAFYETFGFKVFLEQGNNNLMILK